MSEYKMINLAIPLYYGWGTNSFPKACPVRVKSELDMDSPGEVVERIREIERVMFSIPVDWESMQFEEVCKEVSLTLGRKFPFLSDQSLQVFDWKFSFDNR